MYACIETVPMMAVNIFSVMNRWIVYLYLSNVIKCEGKRRGVIVQWWFIDGFVCISNDIIDRNLPQNTLPQILLFQITVPQSTSRNI